LFLHVYIHRVILLIVEIYIQKYVKGPGQFEEAETHEQNSPISSKPEEDRPTNIVSAASIKRYLPAEICTEAMERLTEP
jgi:hypothetical protein